MVGEINVTSQVQAAVERLCVISLVPMATALVQGSFEQYQYGVGGEGMKDIQKLLLDLREQMAYKPQVQALPWKSVRRSMCSSSRRAFSMVGEPGPDLFGPIFVLDIVQAWDTKPQMMYHKMSMQSLAAAGMELANTA